MSDPDLSDTPESSAPSAARLAANRINAQRSTGPRTERGKAASSMNALKHGILARRAVIPELEGADARQEYDQLLAGLIDEYRPQSATEELLVQEVASSVMRLARLRLFETREAYSSHLRLNRGLQESFLDYRGEELELLQRADADRLTIPDLESAHLVIRYESMLTRNMYRALKELRAIAGNRARQLERARRPPPLPPPAPPGQEAPLPTCGPLAQVSPAASQDEVEQPRALEIFQTKPNSSANPEGLCSEPGVPEPARRPPSLQIVEPAALAAGVERLVDCPRWKCPTRT